jgi:cytochrome b6-f complex iron-sulfur subunit
VKDLPVGTLQRIADAPAFIGRDAAGLYALSSTCTHAGCDVAVQRSETTASFNCPCHGSQFDRNGAVTRGPASSPLVHFAVELDAKGNVTVHGGTQVNAEVRMAVP